MAYVEMTIDAYEKLLKSQMAGSENSTFKGIYTNLVDLLTEMDSFLPSTGVEKAISTGANHFQENHFPDHLTDVRLVTDANHFYIFVFAHKKEDEWSEEFYSRINTFCAQNRIDYLTPRRETVIERRPEEA